MKKIGIYTKNFSLYHDIVRALNEKNIPYVIITSPRKISSGVGVVITSSVEQGEFKKKCKVVCADTYSNPNMAVDRALELLRGERRFEKLVIGVDPGEYPGIALYGDDCLLNKWNTNSVSEAVEIIKWILAGYNADNRIIRIGHGSSIIRNKIINEILPLGVQVEIVDEYKTTGKKMRTSKDSDAAAKIALLPGNGRALELELKEAVPNVTHYLNSIDKDGAVLEVKKDQSFLLFTELTLKQVLKIIKDKRSPIKTKVDKIAQIDAQMEHLFRYRF